jgi:hypothetical protein
MGMHNDMHYSIYHVKIPSCLVAFEWWWKKHLSVEIIALHKEDFVSMF